MDYKKQSYLCHTILHMELDLMVCRSGGGYYIGVTTDDGEPLSRDSQEYYKTKQQTEEALTTGNWTQRLHP